MNLNHKFNNLNKLIGNTPLIEIKFLYKDIPLKIYTKLEYFNFTGSIKDRMALHILKQAYEHGDLKQGQTILEATSGNTGISFAAIGKHLGFDVEIIMPDWMSDERKKLLSSYGAKLTLLSKEQGGFIGCVNFTKEHINDNKYYLPSQFSNVDNINAHFLSTGPEIYNKLKANNIKPTGFIAGVGTGGTVMGIGKYLKKKNPKLKIYPLEPSNSPTLSTGFSNGHHRIQGISDEFIPPILNLKDLNEIISVDDGDAIIMAQMLSHHLGLGVGISSGANFIGAVKVLLSQNICQNIVTVFPDDNKKYLSTDLMKNEPMKNNYISKFIKLIDIKSL